MIIEPLEVWELDKFADSAVIIKARIKTKPIRQWTVGREMNRRLKRVLRDPHRDPVPAHEPKLWRSEQADPDSIDKENREELKAIIREVLAETPDVTAEEGAGAGHRVS